MVHYSKSTKRCPNLEGRLGPNDEAFRRGGYSESMNDEPYGWRTLCFAHCCGHDGA